MKVVGRRLDGRPIRKSLAGISAGARQHTPPTNQHQNEDATVKVAGGFARWLLLVL